MRTRETAALLATMLCMSVTPLRLESRVIVVDGAGGGDYLTIKEGVAAAASGDTVYVHPGTYYECGIFINKGITLLGVNPNQCIINGGVQKLDWPDNAVLLIDSTSTCNVQAVTIRYRIGIGISVRNSELILKNSVIDSCFTGVFCTSRSVVKMLNNLIAHNEAVGVGVLNSSKAFLTANVITETRGNGVDVAPGAQAYLKNNVLYRNLWHGLRVAHGSKVIVRNSIIWKNLYRIDSTGTHPDSISITYSDVQPDLYGNPWIGTGNISADPMFADVAAHEFHLQPGSPCVNSGDPDVVYNDVDGSRNDMGAFGGPNGTWIISEVRSDEKHDLVPREFVLLQNHPNPFNSHTLISFVLSRAMHVKLKLYNALGEEIRTIVEEERLPGYHSLLWDGRDAQGRAAASGFYFIRFEAGQEVRLSKVMLVR